MTLQERREYSALRAHIEVCIADYPDEILMTLLTRDITPELSDMIIDELKTRAQRITDAVAGAQDDIPVLEAPCMKGTMEQLDDLWADTQISDVTMTDQNQTISLMHDIFKPFNSK
jgi:hypothetical protein